MGKSSVMTPTGVLPTCQPTLLDLPMTGSNAIDFSAVVAALEDDVPGLSAVYAFGSQIRGNARPDSDLDLALMADETLNAEDLWELSSRLEHIVDCSVDLLDLRAASTVMQYQIITNGRRLWARDGQAALYESFILSQKTALDEARAALLEDIQKAGTVYGR